MRNTSAEEQQARDVNNNNNNDLRRVQGIDIELAIRSWKQEQEQATVLQGQQEGLLVVDSVMVRWTQRRLYLRSVSHRSKASNLSSIAYIFIYPRVTIFGICLVCLV